MNPFVSAEDLAAYTDQTIDDEDLKTILSLDAACEAIRTYTNQDLNLLRHDTVNLHGSYRRDLLLPQLPVIEVHEVSVTDANGDTETLTGDDWHLGEAGILYRTTTPYYWLAGISNIEVEYSHGWGITEDELEESDEPTADRMPSDLRIVALRVASALYDADPAGLVQETLGDHSRTFSTASGQMIDATSTMILDRYVIKGAA